MVKARYRKIGRGWVRVIVFLAFSLFFLVKSVRIYALRLVGVGGVYLTWFTWEDGASRMGYGVVVRGNLGEV